MITCDQTGTVAVWRGISNIAVYKKEGAMTNCVFCDIPFENNNSNQNNLFFFGGKSGLVCLADDQNHISEVCKVAGSIKALVYYQKASSVIIITSTLLMVQFQISMTEKQSPDKKVKLAISGDPEKLETIFIGSCLLCTCSVENQIRFWHLEKDDNYALSLMNTTLDQSQMRDKFNQVQYDKKGNNLVAGTQTGKLVFWKNTVYSQSSPSDTDQWKALPHLDFQKQIRQINIGRESGIIGVSYDNSISLVTETIVKGKMSKNYKILQISQNEVQVTVSNEIQDFVFDINTQNDNIKGLDCNDQYVLIHSNKLIEMHEIIINLKNASNKKISEYAKTCLAAGLHNESIIMFNDYQMDISNFKGIVKQQEKFPESEGKFLGFSNSRDHLVVWTSLNYIKVFDKTRREFRALGQARKFENSQGSLGNIRSCALLSDGKKILIVGDHPKHHSRFYIYDLSVDQFIPYDLQDEVPVEPFTDGKDNRFFGVLCRKTNTEVQEQQLRTFFVTSENGIKQQDIYPLEEESEGIFALNIPQLHLINRDVNNEDEQASEYMVKSIYLNDFQGLEKIDEQIKEAIMNFSFFLSINNLDEAYKSVKSIQNPSVWEKMAQMCVKTKRLDVAEICIGNMRFARGARAIRQSKDQPELEAQLAMVAIQLNMRQEAIKLYEECGRYDLINNLLQSEGKLEEAVELAVSKDRINLKHTYYNLAKDAEVCREIEKAIEYYELSNTHRKEVPRMLMELEEIDKLQSYIEEKEDTELFKFWAQYCESNKDFKNCLQFYRRAKDYASIVRINCYKQQIDEAKKICYESQDIQACFYLARQLEQLGQNQEAIQYFQKAQQYSQAIKIAIDNQMDQEVYQMAIQGTKQVKSMGGKYFEEKGYIDKSITLYRKGQHYQKALNLAQKNKMTQEAREIERELIKYQNEIAKSSVSTGDSVVDSVNRGQYDKAISLCLQSKDFDKIIDIAINNQVQLSEDIIRKMIPEDPKSPQNQKIIGNLAMICKKQSSFALAAELFFLLGDKIKGVKCLINQGDVQKVIAITNQARSAEVYVLAANFLQSTDWHKNSAYMTNIIQYYSKAKAFDNLSQFFDSCSQVEIHEYRDYNKAIQALKEAKKQCGKSTSGDKESRMQMFDNKIDIIEKFVQAQRIKGTDALNIYNQIIKNPGAENCLRIGDVYAAIAEHYMEEQQYTLAQDTVNKMQQRKLVVQHYLEPALLAKLKKNLGIQDDEVGEEIEDAY